MGDRLGPVRTAARSLAVRQTGDCVGHVQPVEVSLWLQPYCPGNHDWPKMFSSRGSGGCEPGRPHAGAATFTRCLWSLRGAGLGIPARGRRFDGSRIGRGSALGRLLGSHDRHGSVRGRRVIVKARLVRLGSTGLGAAHSHLRYIQRDGVERDGSPGMPYSAEDGEADGREFLSRCEGDRHQFRFIVSAEDGDQYEDLKPLVRRLMTQMENDLGTRLDWVAVDHLDTAHPHTHIMLRGRDELGQNLVISREYLSGGMRERLAELVTLDLGPRTDLEIEDRLRRDVGAERLTATDRALVRDMDPDGSLAAGHRDPIRHALRAGRLRKLAALGLAEHVGGDRWRLDERLEERLRALGEQGDIVRTMQRALGAARLERGASDRMLHQAGLEDPIVGRVVARGLLDELSDRHYLIVDGIDGRAHHVGIGRGDAVGALPEGAIVRVEPAIASARAADRTVAQVAAACGGRYGVAIHLRHDPAATEAFAQAHVRRLEAIRRATGGVERLGDASWIIPPDHLERAEAFEAQRLRDRPVRVQILSPLPIERLPWADGATWLDRELVSDTPESLRDGGFGREVKGALAARRQWLLHEELAHEDAGAFHFSRSLLGVLQRRELLRVGGEIAGRMQLPYVEAEKGMTIAARLERRVDLASGRFAMLANSREFTLVPWRDDMARHLGRELEAKVGPGGISWTIGRGRSGPEIG